MCGEAVNPPIFGQEETAFLHHYLRRSFRVHPGSRRGSLFGEHLLCVSPESSCVEGNDGAHGLASRVERVNLLEPRVRHVPSHLQKLTFLVGANISQARQCVASIFLILIQLQFFKCNL